MSEQSDCCEDFSPINLYYDELLLVFIMCYSNDFTFFLTYFTGVRPVISYVILDLF